MVEVTRREKTEEEKKVIEETRNATGKWMGEEKMEDIVKPEPEDGQRVDLKINQIPGITFLEGKLPRIMLDELNAHIDEHREKMADYSGNLVGQIKQTEYFSPPLYSSVCSWYVQPGRGRGLKEKDKFSPLSKS